MKPCADCEGQGRVDVGGYANFGNGLEPYEQLQDCEYCDGTGLVEGDDE